MLKEETRFADGTVFEGIVSIRALIESALAHRRGESENDRRILKILYDRTRETAKKKELLWLAHRGEELGFALCPCSKEEIDALTVGNTHGGLAALCGERTIPMLTADRLPEKGFFVMVEGIEDPYNFGYALRSLYAAGVDGVFLGERNWMTAAGVVCRASAGASEAMPLYRAGEELVPMMRARGYKIVCADLRDSLPIYEADLRRPIFLVVGGEKRGISRGLLEQADIRVRIEYAREFDASLSAASAATLVGYEVYRQNRG